MFLNNFSAISPRNVCVDKILIPAMQNNLRRQNPPPDRKNAPTLWYKNWNTPAGAGLPGLGCVSHYPTAETFSQTSTYNKGVTCLTSMQPDCDLLGTEPIRLIYWTRNEPLTAWRDLSVRVVQTRRILHFSLRTKPKKSKSLLTRAMRRSAVMSTRHLSAY